jgi:hypothetical protein
MQYIVKPSFGALGANSALVRRSLQVIDLNVRSESNSNNNNYFVDYKN